MKKLLLLAILITLSLNAWAFTTRSGNNITFFGASYDVLFESFSHDSFGDINQTKAGAGFTFGNFSPYGGFSRWGEYIKNSLVFISSYTSNGTDIPLEDFNTKLMYSVDYGSLYSFYTGDIIRIASGPISRFNFNIVSQEYFSEFNINMGIGAHILGSISLSNIISINAGFTATYNPFLIRMVSDGWDSNTEILFATNFEIEPMIAIGLKM